MQPLKTPLLPTAPPGHACPLCRAGDTTLYLREKAREYFSCGVCRLVFVPPEYFVTALEEKNRYDLHQNSPSDERYRRFLSRLMNPLCARVAPGSRGLDFGSGPGPTLSVMFEEAGYSMEIYDPFYAADLRAFDRPYDFITATEVIEHLRKPALELGRLWTCLRPGGWLGIMTKLVSGKEAFAAWHYKNDLTHISFYSPHTFRWLASHWGADLNFIGADVILFHK